MEFEEMEALLNARVLNPAGDGKHLITGGYACDMISRVISKISDGQAWITILNSRNVIAAASICECRCVILAESVDMEADTIRLAAENSIPVISTDLTAYEICAALAGRLKG